MSNKMKMPVSIVMDIAAAKLERAIVTEMENGKIGPDLMEFVLYKVLHNLSKEKTGLYSAEIMSIGQNEHDGIIKKTGNVEDLVEDMQKNGVDVTVEDELKGKKWNEVNQESDD